MICTTFTVVPEDTDHAVTVMRQHSDNKDSYGWRDSARYSISIGGQTIQGVPDRDIRVLRELLEAIDKGSF